MSNHKYLILKYFSYVLSFLYLGTEAPWARAENALEALGEAMQDHYVAVKKAGPSATKAQLSEIKRNSYSKANELWEKEVDNLYTNSEKTGSKTASEMARQGKLPDLRPENSSGQASNQRVSVPKNFYNDDFSEPASEIQNAPEPTTPNRKPSSRNTGEIGGAEGAQHVDFGTGEKPKNSPQVKDGIIQDRR